MKINHIITEFVTPQATAQDPGLEREKDVDVIFYGQMPQDFTARTAWKALEDVLPREYPAGSERAQNKIAEVSKNNGAVVTTKPLSIAQKLVKEFQARGIKCRIVQSGLDEDVKVPGPMRMNDYHDQADAIQEKLKQAIQTGNKQLIQQLSTQRDDLDAHVKTHGMMPEDITRRGFLQGAGAAAVAGAAGGAKDVKAQERLKIAVEVGELDTSTKQFEPVMPQQARNFVYLSDSSHFVLQWINSQGNKISEPEVFQAKGPGSDFKNRPNTMYFSNKNAVKVVPNGSPDGDLIYFTPRNWIDQGIGWRSVYYQMFSKVKESVQQGVAEGSAGLPDPQNFSNDNDYRNALDAYGKPQAMDADYENMTNEPDDWFDESREKVGNMDADAFDAALSRMKKLAGAGPLRTVYDPARRVYKNVPHAVQPVQQPKKAR